MKNLILATLLAAVAATSASAASVTIVNKGWYEANATVSVSGRNTQTKKLLLWQTWTVAVPDGYRWEVAGNVNGYINVEVGKDPIVLSHTGVGDGDTILEFHGTTIKPSLRLKV